MSISSKAWTTAAAVICLGLLTIATRMAGLATESYNWDEHTFMLMAQDVLRGHLPYVEHFDNKPPGMFFLLAAVMALFGESLTAVRFVGDAGVLLTAAMLFGLLNSRIGTLPAFLAGAGIIAAFSTPYGLYTSAELISIMLITAAIWLMVDQGERRWTSVLVGLAISGAVLTRSNLGLVAVAIGLVYVAAVWWPWLKLHRGGVIGYVLGGLAPVAVLIAVYTGKGELYRLYVSTVTVGLSFAFGQSPPWTVASRMLAALVNPEAGDIWPMRGFWMLFVVSIVPALAIFDSSRRHEELRRVFVIASTVAVTTATSILLSGTSGLRFLTQMYPGAAVVIGIAIAAHTGWMRRALAGGAVVIVVATMLFLLPRSVDVVTRSGEIIEAYPMRSAAQAIADDRQPGDKVWALRSHLVQFYLNEPPLPWLSTHPDSIDRPAIARPLIEAGYARADEFAYLLALRPRYIVTEKRLVPTYLSKPHREMLKAVLDAEYDQWTRFGGVVVMRLREP